MQIGSFRTFRRCRRYGALSRSNCPFSSTTTFIRQKSLATTLCYCDDYYVARSTKHDVVSSGPGSDRGYFSDPPLLVLASLAGGPKHGHAMIEDIVGLCGTRLGPGTLYGAITRLEQD